MRPEDAEVAKPRPVEGSEQESAEVIKLPKQEKPGGSLKDLLTGGLAHYRGAEPRAADGEELPPYTEFSEK